MKHILSFFLVHHYSLNKDGLGKALRSGFVLGNLFRKPPDHDGRS
ncbi:hypothetical protein ACJD0Z_04205 [Flavobacteriaceae bacterium M23B6Z8]